MYIVHPLVKAAADTVDAVVACRDCSTTPQPPPPQRNVQNIVAARSISTNLELPRPGIHTRAYNIHAYTNDIDIIYSTHVVGPAI